MGDFQDCVMHYFIKSTCVSTTLTCRTLTFHQWLKLGIFGIFNTAVMNCHDRDQAYSTVVRPRGAPAWCTRPRGPPLTARHLSCDLEAISIWSQPHDRLFLSSSLTVILEQDGRLFILYWRISSCTFGNRWGYYHHIASRVSKILLATAVL